MEYKAILPLIFTPKGPYGHSVIGEASHVRAAQAKGILAHHARWYHPNNALLVIAGGIDPADALAKAKKHLGKIPAAKLPPRMELPAEKPQLPARKTMPSKFEVARVLIGYPTVARNHPDEPALDLASSILADGKSSRLYQRLVEKEEIASGASATNDTGRYPGWLGVQVELVAGANLARAEKIIDEEIEKLLESPVGQAELDRVRRQLLAQSIYSRDTVHGLAQRVAMSLVLAAMVLFMVPVGSGGQGRVLDWKDSRDIPWGILLLFGGGLAIAVGFRDTGLSSWMGSQLTVLDNVHVLVIITCATLLVMFLSEVTSNTATATMILPVAAALALTLNIHPFALMIACALAANCAFMLPAGTPPNAIIFATEKLTIREMVWVGFMINLVSTLLIVLLVYYLVPVVFSIDLNVVPDSLRL